MRVLRFVLGVGTLALVSGYAGSAFAQPVPEVCRTAASLLQEKRYVESIERHTSCIDSGSVFGQSLGIAYYNRGLSYALLAFPENAQTDDYLEHVIDDLERSIELDPGYALSYCVLGWAKLEISLGLWDEGYDDIAKGRSLGATDEYFCNDE